MLYINGIAVFMLGFLSGRYYKPLEKNINEINFKYIKNYLQEKILSDGPSVEITRHGHKRLNERMGVPEDAHKQATLSFITDGKDLEDIDNPKIKKIVKHNNGDKLYRKNKYVAVFAVDNYNEFRLITILDQSYIRDIIDRMNRYDIKNNPEKAKEIVEKSL